MTDAERLLEEAMKLADGDRRTLALWLLDSVGVEPPEDVEQAWIEEARRRLDDLRAGRSQAVTWDEAKARIFARAR